MMKNEKIEKLMPAIIMLSLALAIRQMSMTMVMPFISTYCKTLIGYSSIYAGLAVGIFGLMQAVFQIPFGMLSDRYGNKRMMLIGLTQVVLGLVLAYFTKNIGLLIFARALQGSGAVIGVGYSWVAGMAGEKERTHAVSILGAFISAAAAIAFAAGPLLREIMPVNWMFLSSAILLFLNELYILFFIKDHKNRNEQEQRIPASKHIRILFRNKNFIAMNFSAFINNYMMISVFYAIPIYITKITGETRLWTVFVPAIAIAILTMKKAVLFAQKGFNRLVLMASFLISVLSLLFFFQKSSYVFLLLGTILFLCGYITITTTTAANVNNTIDDCYRGTVNGIFNSFQYVGNFIGAVVTSALWSVSEHLTWLVTIAIGIIGFIIVASNKTMNETVQEVKNTL